MFILYLPFSIKYINRNGYHYISFYSIIDFYTLLLIIFIMPFLFEVIYFCFSDSFVLCRDNKTSFNNILNLIFVRTVFFCPLQSMWVNLYFHNIFISKKRRKVKILKSGTATIFKTPVTRKQHYSRGKCTIELS